MKILYETDIEFIKIFFIYLDNNEIKEIQMAKIKINNNLLTKIEQVKLLHKYQYLNENKYKLVDLVYQSLKISDLNLIKNNTLKSEDLIQDIHLFKTYNFLQEINGIYYFMNKINNIKNITITNKTRKKKV